MSRSLVFSRRCLSPHRLLLALCGLTVSCGSSDCPKGSEQRANGLCYVPGEEGPGADDTGGVPDDTGPGPGDTGPDDTGPDDTGPDDCDGLPDGLSPGLPVVLESSIETEEFMEYLDVALLGDGRALLGANNGWSVLDVAAMRFTHVDFSPARSVWRVAADPAAGRAYLGTQFDDVKVLDIRSDPPVLERTLRTWRGWHGDLSADSGRVLVAALDDGAWLIDGGSGETLGQISTHATAVMLDGDRAWVAGTQTVGLYDLSDPSSPTLLADAALPAPAVDAAGDGDRAVFALGAAGVVGLRFDGTGLTLSPVFDTDGAAYGVAADGEAVWAASWRAVSVGRWTDAGPEWLGEAASPMFAMGVDAQDGTAVAADWMLASRYQGDLSLGGPELRMVERIDLPDAGAQSVSLRVENAGIGELSVVWSGEGAPAPLSLCPGASATVAVEAAAVPLELSYEANDLDESTGVISILESSAGLGTVHTDFTLEAIQAGSAESAPWSLSEYAGELVYIAWFAPT